MYGFRLTGLRMPGVTPMVDDFRNGLRNVIRRVGLKINWNSLWRIWSPGFTHVICCSSLCETTVARRMRYLFCVRTWLSVARLETDFYYAVVVVFMFSNYRKNPKYSDTKNICCNHPKIWTRWLYQRVMHAKDAAGIANSVDSDQELRIITVAGDFSIYLEVGIITIYWWI